MLEAVVILFVVAPLLPLLPGTHWSIRFFDFVRVQMGVLQFILLILLFLAWKPLQDHQWILILCLASVLAYQLWLIQPYTPFYHRRKPQQEFHKNMMKLVTANVLQTNRAYDRFIKIIKDAAPDIFITMESDAAWDEAISDAFPEYLHTVKASLDNFYGMHLYSKLPLDTHEVAYLVEHDIPSIHTQLTFADQQFNLIAIHPAPPSPSENETSKERDAELMLIGKKCRGQEKSTVVCGDLNDVVWSKTSRLFKRMTGYLDPRVGRGLYPSFHANYWLLRFPLDHLFYSKDMHVPKLRRLPDFGSDHFAMYYELLFPLVDVNVANPEITEEDNEEVDQIINEGIESARETEREEEQSRNT